MVTSLTIAWLDMPEKPEDVCPRPDFLDPQPTQPVSPPIYTSSVYRCSSPEQAARLLAGDEPGYVYSRDGHPNGDLLAEKCRRLHGADRAVICGSGMSALAVAALALVEPGDHLLVSDQLYGRTTQLLVGEMSRLGVTNSVIDTCDLAAVERALTEKTRLVVVETITNPLLKVSDIRGLADLAHVRGAQLLVDNTFAGPTLCRPLEWGADLVVESLTKIMSGHSDVLLGLLCGRAELWTRVPGVLSTWGLSASPFDCWLCARGLGTLALRADRASANAMVAARFLEQDRRVATVCYPGLARHAGHDLARRQFGERYGSMVTMTLSGGAASAEAFIKAAREIPFCPSLGDLSTTLSHPASTSHRAVPAELREAQGISAGTIRLSIGIESPEAIVVALAEGLVSVDA